MPTSREVSTRLTSDDKRHTIGLVDSDRGAFAPGMVLGTHRLDRLLGRGGMGAVFLAYDTRLHRQVAVKVIDSDAGDAMSSARLLREARNAAALNHPHICTIHEVGESGPTAFIAMEYVRGRSLREWSTKTLCRWTRRCASESRPPQPSRTRTSTA